MKICSDLFLYFNLFLLKIKINLEFQFESYALIINILLKLLVLF